MSHLRSQLLEHIASNHSAHQMKENCIIDKERSSSSSSKSKKEGQKSGEDEKEKGQFTTCITL
jgi:hypothetical protein